jgi:hypothetical protein
MFALVGQEITLNALYLNESTGVAAVAFDEQGVESSESGTVPTAARTLRQVHDTSNSEEDRRAGGDRQALCADCAGVKSSSRV